MTGEQIRQNRTKLRLSQSELARKANISRYKLNSCEAGGPLLASHEIVRIHEVFRRESQRLLNNLLNFEEGVESNRVNETVR